MSEFEKEILVQTKALLKFTKIDLKIRSLRIYKVVEQEYLGELHKEIEKIEELTPNSDVFIELELEHKDVGKCRAIIKGRVDLSGHIDFAHAEMPTIPIRPEDIEADKTLKEKIAEFFEKYQNYVSTLLNAVINVAIAIIKKKLELG